MLRQLNSAECAQLSLEKRDRGSMITINLRALATALTSSLSPYGVLQAFILWSTEASADAWHDHVVGVLHFRAGMVADA
jgi:hypothetical protein